jgi:hypothetical protein
MWLHVSEPSESPFLEHFHYYCSRKSAHNTQNESIILKTAVEMAAKDHKEHKENWIQGKWMSWTHTCRVRKFPSQLCFKILTLRSLRSLAANRSALFRFIYAPYVLFRGCRFY